MGCWRASGFWLWSCWAERLDCGIRQLPLSFWRWAVGGRLAFGVGARLRRTLALDCGVRLPLIFWRRAFGGRLAFGFRRSGTDNAPWPVFVERGRRGRALPHGHRVGAHVFTFTRTYAHIYIGEDDMAHIFAVYIHHRFCIGIHVCKKLPLIV